MMSQSHHVKAMLRLEYKPTATSRKWLKSSLMMHLEAAESIEAAGRAMQEQERWHSFRIMTEAVQ